ncbi:MAG: serine aminopeptidase domain-containing protein [Anaerolineae bacterium]
MSQLARLILVIVLLAGSLPAPSAVATSVVHNGAKATEVATTASPVPATDATSSCEPDGRQESGAIYRICMPAPDHWNGDLVVYAHGYVAPDEPVGIPEDQLGVPGGPSLPQIVNMLGFAFATTSYSTNGLAVREGVEDVRDLVDIFSETHRLPRRVYLVGASEGGIITTLAVEKYPETFDGGLAACGPIGDFRRQVNNWGDFRTVFDYFFPDVIPGNPVDIPAEVIDNWETEYAPRIKDAIWSDQQVTRQLLRVTRAPTDRRDPESVETTVLNLLWYNVVATRDGIAKLGGQPFDNMHRLYFGSDNDFRLNRRIQRFRADQAALDEIEAYYETSGDLKSPLVTLHTTGDPIVPYWHVPLYRWKVFWKGAALRHSNVPALRYGHCNFKASEVLVSFALLVLKVTGEELIGVESVLPDASSRAEFLQLAEQHGALKMPSPELEPSPTP